MEHYFEKMCAAADVAALDGEALEEANQEEMIVCIQQFSAYAKLHASTRRPGHNIEIGFFDDDQVNAFAATWQGEDAIAISWGVVTQLREAFSKVVFVPGRFAWLADDKRTSAATWLYECAKHFIFLHELGHIWNGHTSLINQKGIASFIFELRAFGSDALGNLDLQTMELDADGFAAANIFNLGVIHNAFPSVNPKLEDAYGPNATNLAMVAFAVYFVFRMFDEAADFDDEETYSHPSPPLRQRLIAATLAAHAERNGLMSEANAWPIIAAGVNAAEDLFALYAGKERDDQAMKEAFGPEGEKYTKKLLRHWHILRPQLDKLKRGGVLPEVQPFDDH